MKLLLFSDKITKAHIEKMSSFFSKPLAEVKMLHISTPINYKAEVPDWFTRQQAQLKKIFPDYTQFDLESTCKKDKGFDFESYYKDFDYIHVSGGNTFLLSYWMEETGSDKILKDMITKEELVYGGESAGAIYVCKELEPYSLADKLSYAPRQVNRGLGLVDFALLPHWDNEKFKDVIVDTRNWFEKLGYEVVTLNDDQALFVSGGGAKVV